MGERTEHSPGPWTVEQPWSGFSEIRAADGKLVFGLAAGLPHERLHEEICIANARLIAAAPDLYAALTEMDIALIACAEALNVPDECTRDELCGNRLCAETGCVVGKRDRTRAALARAKPEQKGE